MLRSRLSVFWSCKWRSHPRTHLSSADTVCFFTTSHDLLGTGLPRMNLVETNCLPMHFPETPKQISFCCSMRRSLPTYEARAVVRLGVHRFSERSATHRLTNPSYFFSFDAVFCVRVFSGSVSVHFLKVHCVSHAFVWKTKVVHDVCVPEQAMECRRADPRGVKDVA